MNRHQRRAHAKHRFVIKCPNCVGGPVVKPIDTEDHDPSNMNVRAGYLIGLANRVDGRLTADDREMLLRASRSLMHASSPCPDQATSARPVRVGDKLRVSPVGGKDTAWVVAGDYAVVEISEHVIHLAGTSSYGIESRALRHVDGAPVDVEATRALRSVGSRGNVDER